MFSDAFVLNRLATQGEIKMAKVQKTCLVTSPLNLPLLRSESVEEYFDIRERLTSEIKPQGIIEELYIEDMAGVVFDIRRLQRCKIGIINSALLEALTNLLKQLLPEPDYGFSEHEKEIDALARDWFVKKSAKQEVLKILQAFGLDETAIEAEAMRIKAGELELFDRMLTLARSRFDRAIRCVSEYKDSLARRLRQNADQILQTDHPPGLEYAPAPASAAA
jgi:hypothetical protein